MADHEEWRLGDEPAGGTPCPACGKTNRVGRDECAYCGAPLAEGDDDLDPLRTLGEALGRTRDPRSRREWISLPAALLGVLAIVGFLYWWSGRVSRHLELNNEVASVPASEPTAPPRASLPRKPAADATVPIVVISPPPVAAPPAVAARPEPPPNGEPVRPPVVVAPPRVAVATPQPRPTMLRAAVPPPPPPVRERAAAPPPPPAREHPAVPPPPSVRERAAAPLPPPGAPATPPAPPLRAAVPPLAPPGAVRPPANEQAPRIRIVPPAEEEEASIPRSEEGVPAERRVPAEEGAPADERPPAERRPMEERPALGTDLVTARRAYRDAIERYNARADEYNAIADDLQRAEEGGNLEHAEVLRSRLESARSAAEHARFDADSLRARMEDVQARYR